MESIEERSELKELIMSMIYQMEALTNLLDSKGIVPKQDLLEEMKRIHEDLMIAKGKTG